MTQAEQTVKADGAHRLAVRGHLIVLTVPATPPSPNVIRRRYRHPHAYRELRQVWAWELKAAAAIDGFRLIALADRQCKMHVQIHIAHKQLFDPDNLVGATKVILDALREIHVLYDDSPKFLELEVMQQKSRSPYTRITMEAATNGE